MASPAVLAYPTRTGEAQMTYRQEPVLWSDDEERSVRPLDAEQLATYESEGFLVLPGYLGDGPVASLRDAVEALARDKRRAGDPRYVLGADADDVRRVQGLHFDDGPIAALVRSDVLAGAARQILGDEVYVHHSRANRMPGTFGEGFPWHADFERWHAEDGMPAMRALGVSVSLSPTDEFGGALVLAPGSHRTFISVAGNQQGEAPTGWDYRREPDLYCIDAVLDSCGIARVDAGPGTVVLFDSNALHATLPNLSPDPVLSLFVAYNSVSNALGEPRNGRAPRPEFVASRDFTPLPS